jgi:histidyl-tRNA synthetase
MTSVMKAANSDSSKIHVSRTNAEHIAVIEEFLTKFYLHEITFVVHLNSIYSLYDIERVERITLQLRLTFGTAHDVNDVRGLLDFFLDQSRRPQAWHHIDIDQHLLIDSAAHHMEPFIAVCPVCHQHLNKNNCKKTMVYICHQRGRVLPGISSRVMFKIMFFICLL